MKQVVQLGLESRDSTPVPSSKVNFALTESKLEPFDQNYTLTGLLKDIQSSINKLISSKKHEEDAPAIDAQAEMDILEKVQEEVVILKTIIIHNINQIFSSIYPNCKSENPTNHTDTHKRKNENQLLNKSMTISDFDLEGNNKINAFEVNKENLAHHQKLYSDERESQDILLPLRQHKKRENECHDTIRIEDEGCFEMLEDLICYEDEALVINKKKYIDESKNIKDSIFSPISERPIEEEYSVQKGVMESKKQNIEFDERKICFNPYRQNFYVRICQREAEAIKKSLFGHNGQMLDKVKRVSHRKFNYLEQFHRN